MSLPHRFHPIAEQEFTEARTRYARARENLGLDFFAKIRDKIALICENPNLFPAVARVPEVRKALLNLNRFPYATFYTVECNEIVVVSVYHGKRRPGGWRKRLEDI